MMLDLKKHGPATIGDLLDHQGYGPSHWTQMDEQEKACVRMAIARLMTQWEARLDYDGRLHLSNRRRRAA
jgi:hypothetical protein